jgi:hypothetical protein
MANLIKSSKASYIALMKARVKIVNEIAGVKLISDTGVIDDVKLKEVNKLIQDKKINKIEELVKVFSYVKTMKAHIDNDEFASKTNLELS